jgi:hypothetical protein
LGYRQKDTENGERGIGYCGGNWRLSEGSNIIQNGAVVLKIRMGFVINWCLDGRQSLPVPSCGKETRQPSTWTQDMRALLDKFHWPRIPSDR